MKESKLISNDERREVAARLREEAERHCEGFDSLTLMGVLKIDLEAEPFFDGFHRYHDLATFETWNRLADLIEPEERTCRMEFSERKRGVYCSHCGERMDIYTCDQYGDGTIGYSYPFCYKCGAKVVD